MLWNKSYETGVPLMDAQHQELFRQMDLLADKSQAGKVPQILDFLGHYVDKHFREEEQLQTASRYPHYAEHKKLHKDFVEQYMQLLEEYRQKSDRQGLMTLRINRVALEWLRKHISGPDKMFAKYYLEKQPNGQPALAMEKKESPPARPLSTYTTPDRTKPVNAPHGTRHPTDEDVLKRVPAQALADELVRRSRAPRPGG